MWRAMALVLVLSASCGEAPFFSSTQRIPQATWGYDQAIDFSFEIPDTTVRYNLVLEVEHSFDYLYQNTYLMIATRFPDGKRQERQVPIDFANGTGEWYGQCSSKTCDLQVLLQENAIFNQMGTYMISIQQFTRDNPLEGISQVGLKLFPFKPVSH